MTATAAALTIALLLGTTPAATAPTPEAPTVITPDLMAQLRTVHTAKISPDGKRIAYTLAIPRDPFADDDGGSWVELHITGSRPGTSRPYIFGETNVRGVRWHPDGSAVTFIAKRGKDKKAQLYAIPVDGGESRRIASHSEGISAYDISRDGKRLVILAKATPDKTLAARTKKGFKAKVVEEQDHPVQAWVLDLDPAKEVTTKDVEPLAAEGSLSSPHWSPNGKLLAVGVAPSSRIDDHYMRNRVRVLDPATGAVRATIANVGKLGKVQWSPDGSKIALQSAADYNDPSNGRLMVVSARGGEPKDILPGLADNDVVDFEWQSASSLAFIAADSCRRWIGQVSASGGKHRVLVKPGAGNITSMSASSNGGSFALTVDKTDHPSEVYALGKGKRAPVRWTTSNPELEGLKLGRQEIVRYKARDGVEIHGVLIRPIDEKRGTRYPLIMVVHGGPESHMGDGWLTAYSRPGHMGAARGFMVFHPNYRGSTGRGVAFSKMGQADYAGGEFNDLVDAITHFDKAGLIDPKKVGITGGSYGGFATAWAATALTEHFAAGVMFVGISDQISKFGTTDIPEEMHAVHSRRWPWDHWDWFRERSPIYHSVKARTPLLILHGEDDTRVPTSQGKELFRYLKTLGNVPVRLVLYPGEGHGNRKAAARLDYNLRVLRWMEHYLQGPGGAPPDVDVPLDVDRLGVKPAADEATPNATSTDETPPATP